MTFWRPYDAGMPQDCANLVRFLCSKEGGWINSQLLYRNRGLL